MTPKESLGRVRRIYSFDPAVVEKLTAASEELHIPVGNIVDELVFRGLDNYLEEERKKRGKT